MKRLLLILLILLLLASNTYAGMVVGKIEKMIVGRQGTQVFVHLVNVPQTCGKDHSLGYNYYLSLSGHAGAKEIYSALLAAQMTDREIGIQGTGQCTAQDSIEDISYVITQ